MENTLIKKIIIAANFADDRGAYFIADLLDGATTAARLDNHLESLVEISKAEKLAKLSGDGALSMAILSLKEQWLKSAQVARPAHSLLEQINGFKRQLSQAQKIISFTQNEEVPTKQFLDAFSDLYKSVDKFMLMAQSAGIKMPVMKSGKPFKMPSFDTLYSKYEKLPKTQCQSFVFGIKTLLDKFVTRDMADQIDGFDEMEQETENATPEAGQPNPDQEQGPVQPQHNVYIPPTSNGVPQGEFAAYFAGKPQLAQGLADSIQKNIDLLDVHKNIGLRKVKEKAENLKQYVLMLGQQKEPKVAQSADNFMEGVYQYREKSLQYLFDRYFGNISPKYRALADQFKSNVMKDAKQSWDAEFQQHSNDYESENSSSVQQEKPYLADKSVDGTPLMEPLSLEEVQQMLASGTLDANSEILDTRSQDMKAVKDMPELSTSLPQTQPASAPQEQAVAPEDPLPPANIPMNFKQVMNEAHKKFNAGDQSAQALYEQALQAATNDAEKALAYNGLGDSSLNNRDFDKALESFWAAIEIDPDSASNWYGMSHAYQGQGKMDDSIKSLKRYLELEPNAENSQEIAQYIQQFETSSETAPEYSMAAVKAEIKSSGSNMAPATMHAIKQWTTNPNTRIKSKLHGLLTSIRNDIVTAGGVCPSVERLLTELGMEIENTPKAQVPVKKPSVQSIPEPEPEPQAVA